MANWTHPKPDNTPQTHWGAWELPNTKLSIAKFVLNETRKIQHIFIGIEVCDDNHLIFKYFKSL